MSTQKKSKRHFIICGWKDEDMVMLFEALVGQVAESGGLEGEPGQERSRPGGS